MRITNINMPVLRDYGDGLGPICMRRLGPIVILAGPNGSGKSRLLRRVVTRATNMDVMRGARSELQNQLQEAKKRLESREPVRILESYKSQVLALEKQVEETYWLELSEEKKKPEVLDFVPKATQLEDCYNESKSGLTHRANAAHGRGVGHLHSAVFAKIQLAQNLFMEATHPECKWKPEKKREKVISDYRSLCEVVKTFLGTDITRSEEGDAEIFGFRLGLSQLSEGQVILLQFCLAIYAQSSQLKDLIVTMDEPENHLHPAAAIEVINAIRKHITNGQLWIATHSIPLVAQFPHESIWWVENNTVAYAGNIPQRVLAGLLGDEDRIARLSDFLNLPATLAGVRFAHQCLFPPATADSRGADPQTSQVKTAIQKGRRGSPIRVLDFGAGKGRLASDIFDAEETDKATLKEWLDYVAFDPDSKDKAVCEDAVVRIYGTSANRYFNAGDELLSKHNPASFDVAVMCNVLHEIDPAQWLNVFHEQGLIRKLLKPRGFLLIVEDEQMPVGEKAHQKGFLVLSTAQLRELFQLKDGEFDVSSERDGRLKAHRISKDCLNRITAATRAAALRSLVHLAKQRVEELRQQESSYQNGRRHAFWMAQFANAQLALDQLG